MTNVVFLNPDDRQYALDQYEKFGRCPHLYIIVDTDGIWYGGSRYGKNSPLNEYWGSHTEPHEWSKDVVRVVVKLFPGDTPSGQVDSEEQEMLIKLKAAEDSKCLNKTNFTKGQSAKSDAGIRVMHSPEAREKALASNNANGNFDPKNPNSFTGKGIRAARAPDVIEKRVQTRHENNDYDYYNPNSLFRNFIDASNTPEAIAKSVETKRVNDFYNVNNSDSSFSNMHSPESQKKALATKQSKGLNDPSNPNSPIRKMNEAWSVPVEVKLNESDDWIRFPTACAAVLHAGYTSGSISRILNHIRNGNGLYVVTTGFKKFRGISFRFPVDDKEVV